MPARYHHCKKHLNQEELNSLNRIITLYLGFAEDQTQHRKEMTMQPWDERLNAFLAFNEREVLTNAGKISKAIANKLANRATRPASE